LFDFRTEETDPSPDRIQIQPGVNFTNILRTAFSFVDPESVKNTVQLSHQYLFTLLGSAHVKAVHRMLMKLSPEWDPQKVGQPNKHKRIELDVAVKIHCSFSIRKKTSHFRIQLKIQLKRHI
jgi:hypothetical protein